MVVLPHRLPAADTAAAAEDTSQAADTGTADTEAAEDTEVSKDATAADAAYTIGISQFAEHGSLDNCREGSWQDLRRRVLQKVRISPFYLTMHRLTPEQQVPFPIIMFPRR